MTQPFLSGPATGRLLRPFALAAADGGTVRLSDFRQRSNLLVVLRHGDTCGACARFLAELGARSGEYAEAEAVLLAIGPDPATEATVGVTALRDATGLVASQEGLSVPAVVVTDRFAEVWAMWAAGADHVFPSADDLAEWLRFVAIQCRECEAPEWPAPGDP